MPEPEHNLPTQFNRLDDQITGNVLDAIMVYPRSRGILYLPGEYSTASQPPARKVDIGTGDPGNPGVYTQQNQLGGPDHYVVNYDIWNHRDSPAFARIILTEPAHRKAEDTPGG
jgi:hypothetical protein